jgi:uncharacterized protein involved in outer membrane biogenesis
MFLKKPGWLVILIALVLLFPGLYWFADTWLESSGGRQMLERELGARFGMRVRLEGEFDLMLLPDIGVSGTDLVIGGDGSPGSFFASSREFEVSVALKPLFRNQVVIDWIRLTGGQVYPARYSQSGAGSETGPLPEIRELTLRDFDLVLAEGKVAPLSIKTLKVSDFAERRQAAFSVDVEDLVNAEGWLLWDTEQSKIQFGELRFDLAGQVLAGEACLLLQEPSSLNAELTAGTFDFDALRDRLPDTGEGGGDLPLEIRVRLKVDELHSSGVVARGVVLNLGPDPVCE